MAQDDEFRGAFGEKATDAVTLTRSGAVIMPKDRSELYDSLYRGDGDFWTLGPILIDLHERVLELEAENKRLKGEV